jgi:hypothetical protein
MIDASLDTIFSAGNKFRRVCFPDFQFSHAFVNYSKSLAKAYATIVACENALATFWNVMTVTNLDR